MQEVRTMVLGREVQSGPASVPLTRRAMALVAHTLALFSPDLPSPTSCACWYSMDLRGDLLADE